MRAYRSGSNLARVLEFISENPGSGLDDIASGLNIRRLVGRRERCTSP